MTKVFGGFTEAQEFLKKSFQTAPEVHAQKWQGFDVSERPEAKMIELLLENYRVPIHTEDLDHWRKDIPANFPWADDHFEERVCGFPINPGIQWAKWPWGNKAKDSLDLRGTMFNHNYMERYWPKYAGMAENPTATVEDWSFIDNSWVGEHKAEPIPNHGIREQYGDLNDLVNTLSTEPDTRQAYYPMFFPEDVTVKGRKPCSLGYHFILRHGYFHCVYYMRSCDFYRHWADDCYLTLRLQLWVLEKCRALNPDVWNDVKPGFLEMHVTSLHMFINDAPLMGIERR